MIFYSFVYEKRYNRMGSLDEKISVVKAKPWLVSLVCAVFIAYPNLAWIFCDMSYLAPNDHQGFLLFFGFRFLYFWGLIWFLLKSNLRHEDCTSFFERLLWNALYVSGGFVVYKLISFLTISYDRFLSIIIFQFIVLALLCTLIGYIQMLSQSTGKGSIDRESACREFAEPLRCIGEPDQSAFLFQFIEWNLLLDTEEKR